jgi:hypothetical protein
MRKTPLWPIRQFHSKIDVRAALASFRAVDPNNEMLSTPA